MTSEGLSDGLGSLVEHEDLVVVGWVVLLHSQSVLVGSDVLSHLNHQFGRHGRSELELNSIINWIVWNECLSSLDRPLLVGAPVAWPSADQLVVGVSVVSDVHALVGSVSDLASSSSFSNPSPLLVLVVELSGDQIVASANVESISPSVRDGKVSSLGLSDGLGSAVEHEELVALTGIVVSHSECELVTSDVLSNLNGSSGSQGSLDLELDFIFQWVVWNQWLVLDDGPSLVSSVVAVPGAQVVVVGVSVSNNVHALADGVSEVSAISIEPLPSLVLSVVLSGDQVVRGSNGEFVSKSVRDGVVSSVELSDGVGSGIEGEELVAVGWVTVLHSQDELPGPNVLSNLDHSS